MITVYDTYANPGGVFPSTRVTYGQADWPSYSGWLVYVCEGCR